MDSKCIDVKDATLTPLDIFFFYNCNTNLEVERRKINVKGIYSKGIDRPYGNFYFDIITDPNNESLHLSIKIHGNLREKLNHGNLYTFSGFLLKKEDMNRHREIGFKLLLNVSDIVDIEKTSEDSERIKALEERLKIDEERNKIRKEKKLKKEKSVEKMVERKVSFHEKISIALICGMSETKAEGDIMGEIKKLPTELQSLFEITKQPVSMNSVHDIAQSLKNLDSQGYNLICLSRGGGSKEEINIFNDLTLARTAVEIKTPFLATIGHGTDTPFIEEISDWKEPFNLQPVKIGEILRESAERASYKEIKQNEQKEIRMQYEKILKEKDNALELIKSERDKLDNGLKLLRNEQDKFIKERDGLKDSHEKILKEKDNALELIKSEHDKLDNELKLMRNEQDKLIMERDGLKDSQEFSQTGMKNNIERNLRYIAFFLLIIGIILGILVSKVF